MEIKRFINLRFLVQKVLLELDQVRQEELIEDMIDNGYTLNEIANMVSKLQKED
jgi:hypoxanthine-guanine phosphoribosyltransferase